MLTDAQLREIRLRVRRDRGGETVGDMGRGETPAERDVLRTIERFKRLCTPYPRWSEVVAIFKALGWQEPVKTKVDEG